MLIDCCLPPAVCNFDSEVVAGYLFNHYVATTMVRWPAACKIDHVLFDLFMVAPCIQVTDKHAMLQRSD